MVEKYEVMAKLYAKECKLYKNGDVKHRRQGKIEKWSQFAGVVGQQDRSPS